MSAPPAFVFEGDTFAVPSWEFACELPPPASSGVVAPHRTTTLFGVRWMVHRAIQRGLEQDAAVLVAPNGEGVVVSENGRSALVALAPSPRAGEVIARADTVISRTADEFMQALRAIAERNEQ